MKKNIVFITLCLIFLCLMSSNDKACIYCFSSPSNIFNIYECEEEFDDNLSSRDPFGNENFQTIPQNFIPIPIGYNCRVASVLRKHKLRSCAFPFDWCLTPCSAIYTFIKNDFNNFMNKENFVPSGPAWVVDSFSGMIFAHDFPNNLAETINNMYDFQYAKYQRRIKYFYEAINSGKHIYFIRYYKTTKKEACELCNLIGEKFPSLSFTLVVINVEKDLFGDPWNIPHIKNFYVDEVPMNTSVDHPIFWEKFCADLLSGALMG